MPDDSADAASGVSAPQGDAAGRKAATDRSPRRRPSPLYARALNLRYLRPGRFACFLCFEGTVVAAMVLALAGWVSWWGVAILPTVVALMVKLNDAAAGCAAARRP